LLVVRIIYAAIIGLAAGLFHTWNLFFILGSAYCGFEFVLFVFVLKRATRHWGHTFSFAFAALYLSIVTVAIFGALTKFITDLLTIS